MEETTNMGVEFVIILSKVITHLRKQGNEETRKHPQHIKHSVFIQTMRGVWRWCQYKCINESIFGEHERANWYQGNSAPSSEH